MVRPDFLRIIDIRGVVHHVNVNYIVQIYSKKHFNRGYAGTYEERTSYLVNVANAGVACYNADEIEVSVDVYNELIKAF